MVDFKRHLSRQLGFLHRSAAAYDAGATDEAIRMAVTMRVLFHQTRSSTSLLTHLGASNVRLLSTPGSEEIGPRVMQYFGLGLTRMGGVAGLQYIPQLGDGPPIHAFIEVARWWGQTVYVLNPDTRLTRKLIVLNAANKDGGAHVDHQLDREYEELASNFPLSGFQVQDGVVTEYAVDDAHFVAIRQMAYEVLHSPELLALSDLSAADAPPAHSPDR